MNISLAGTAENVLVERDVLILEGTLYILCSYVATSRSILIEGDVLLSGVLLVEVSHAGYKALISSEC